MSYTASNLVMDVLPRAGKLPPSGITIYGAANSITSIIFKVLLERQSDLLASGNLKSILPANGYIVPLPSDWLSSAEKPGSIETVGLVDNLTVALIAAGLSAPNQATLESMLATGAGVNVSDIQLLIPGTNVQSIVDTLSSTSQAHRFQPSYLNEDDNDDLGWWNWYGASSQTFEPPAHSPRKMKIFGFTMFTRPKVINDSIVSCRYNQKPASITGPTSVVPFSGFFDEVYREGAIKILSAGLAYPDSDPAFAGFIHREVETVVNSRARLIKTEGRTKRSIFM